MDRRKLLVGTVAISSVAVVGAAMFNPRHLSAADVKPSAPADFLKISQLLVGARQLDSGLATPAWNALVQREKNFEGRFSALREAMSQAAPHGMTDWASSAVIAAPDLKATALAILGAWYLGRVGEVVDRSEDGPAFITYGGALMWAPTIDVTVIPTYARGGPGFWAKKPSPVVPV